MPWKVLQGLEKNHKDMFLHLLFVKGRALLQHLPQVQLTQAFREANSVADGLAHMEGNTQVGTWIHSPLLML